MTKQLLIAAIASVAAGLTGCATTDSQSDASKDGTKTTATTGTGTDTGTGSKNDVTTRNPRDPRDPAGSTSPDLKRSVFYEFDKYDVKPEYRALVESHARWLKSNPGAKLVIEGNADEQGSREYNLALGQRRAESVTKMMQLMGVSSNQLEAISYGEERPRSDGHDEKAWSQNRRSDFARR
jgi:peptidoglycan-associated lipoprotein